MVLKLKNRFMVVLTEEDLIKIDDVLNEKIRSLIHTDMSSDLSRDEIDALNREYAVLGDLRAKFYGRYVIED